MQPSENPVDYSDVHVSVNVCAGNLLLPDRLKPNVRLIFLHFSRYQRRLWALLLCLLSKDERCAAVRQSSLQDRLATNECRRIVINGAF